MSLYGDLPQAKKEAANSDAKPTAAKGWASTAAKLQPRKSSAPLAPPSSVLRAGRGGRHGGPPIVLGRGAGRGPPPSIVPSAASAGPAATSAPRQEAGATASTSGPTIVVATPLLGPGGSLFVGPAGGALLSEYDPAVPNDYEAVTRERERRRKEAEEEAERQRHRKEAEAVRACCACSMRCATCPAVVGVLACNGVWMAAWHQLVRRLAAKRGR